MSLAGLLLLPVAFPPMSTLGALAVDLAVLVAVLWYALVSLGPEQPCGMT